MSWNYERMYRVYALATPSAAVQPWVRDVWREVEQAILGVEMLCSGPIATRAFGLWRTARNYHKEYDNGRLSWDQVSSDRWSVEHDFSGETPPEIEFGGLEAWAPHWDRCLGEDGPPDLFVSVANPFPAFKYPLHQWRARMVLAFAVDFGAPAAEQFATAVQRVCNAVGCSHVGRMFSPWGHAYSLDAFSSAIQGQDPFMSGGKQRFLRPAVEALDLQTWEVIAVGDIGP